MFSRLKLQRLCHSCRSDLQKLFENAFCVPTVTKVTRPFPVRSVHRVNAKTRHFSSSRNLFLEELTKKDDESTENVSPESALEEEMLAIQDAAIAELEAKLGKSLQRAIEEDKLAEQVLPQHYLENTNRAGSEILHEDADDPVGRLRDAGASSEDVVREARQLFGESLPETTLTDEELKIYKRLYGEPMTHTAGDYNQDLSYEQTSGQALFGVEGEQLAYRLEDEKEIEEAMSPRDGDEVDIDEDLSSDYNEPLGQISPGVLDPSIEALRINDPIQGGDIVKAGEYEAESEEGPRGADTRAHPLTRLGKFSTYPKTTFLPQDSFVKPVERIMSNYSNKHLKETCEKLFGGPGLPDSPLTPRSGRSRPQVPISLQANQNTMSPMEANAFITTVMPPTYASILSVLVETRKRLGASWLNKVLARPGGPRVLDAGSGGVGIVAWNEVVQAHWETLHSSDSDPPPPPPSKKVVLTSSDTLRHRAAEILENTTFIPRLPDYVHTRGMPTMEDDRPAQQRKQFDVIIASHSLFSLKEDWERKQHVQNLWSLLSSEGGVLIIIEKGIPRGFEALAGAREMLLERCIASPDGHSNYYSSMDDSAVTENKQTGMIIAPCTTHDRCPLYHVRGMSHGRKDFCSFQQRYIRPPFLQRVLGAKSRNHDDVDFSYISVMKGDDLRNRHITTWEQVDDPISAPVHPTPAVLAEDPKIWLSNVGKGLGSFNPAPASESSPFASKNSQSESDGFPYPDGLDRPNLPTAHNLPRAIFPPLKGRGQVILDFCTPAATVERWILRRAFDKQAYRDARKARWGDLWALGAKTRTPRNLKLGVPVKEMEGKTRGEMGKARSKRERQRMQAEKILQAQELESEAEEREAEEIENMMMSDEDIFDEVDDADDLDGMIDPDTLLPRRLNARPKKQSQLNSKSSTSRPLQSSRSSREHPSPQFFDTTADTPRQDIAPLRNLSNRFGESDPLLDWAEELDGEIARATTTRGGKRGGAFAGRSSNSTKAAKRDQKMKARTSR